MSLQNESRHPGEHIVSEANGALSVDQETLIAGQNLVAGTVLGKITASGKFTQFDQDGADGSEAAAGILYAAVDATDADSACVIHLRQCEVDAAALTWPADINTAEQEAAETELRALGVIPR